MTKKNYYITTTAPYVNSSPHVGFALEIVQADAIARYHKLLGEKVVFSFGVDEHGLKIYRKAQENKLTPQEYCDQSIIHWNELKTKLNLSYTNFVRTTNPEHMGAAQEMWRRCLKNGDIYKKTYQCKYCVGCELEKTDSELMDGKCPIHPTTPIELIDEENYFFRFSKYQQPLLNFYEAHSQFVVPESKYKEIKAFVKAGLRDFSISRVKNKMPWGAPIPDDPDQVMYVWFDALTFYISTLGWPEDEDNFEKFWGTKEKANAIQVAGKDNLRQQTAIWQAMLMSAGLPNSKQVFIHGFININGQKISKSQGDVVNPFNYVEKYGTDAVRYFLLAKINPYDDSDFTIEKFEAAYNADLANGLGNLVARVAKLAEKGDYRVVTKVRLATSPKIGEYLNNFRFDLAVEFIWNQIKELDTLINKEEPWKLDSESLNNFLKKVVPKILALAYELKPFLPDTAEKIWHQFSGPLVKSEASLFPRIK